MALTRPKAAQIDFDVTNITDPLFRLNSGQSDTNDKDTGIVIERGSDTNTAIIWDESADEFAVINTTEDGTTSGDVTISSYANIRANAFYGDGSNLTGISGGGGSSDVVSDTTPQLGGNLDAQSNQITAVSKLEITNTSTDDSLLITTTEDTSTAAPVLTFKRNSSSPADADYLGQIKFKGENDADQEIVYAKITGKIQDATDGTEDGMIEYAFKKGGSNNISARFRGDALQLLNGTNLYIGSTGLIQFEGSTADAYETNLTVQEPTADRTITLQDGSGTLAFLSDVTGGSTAGSFTTVTIDNNIIFEGATADDFETTLTVTDPTADRTITLPNETGTVHTSGGPIDIYSASSDPSTNLTAGQIYYNTTDKYYKFYNGTEWAGLSSPTVSVDTVDPFGDNSAVALWQLNGNANDAGGNYNLSGDTGSSNFTTGKFGSAFNGTGTNHLISTASELNVSGDFSVSFWYKSNNTGQGNKRVLTVKGQNRTAGFNNFNNSLGFYHGSGETSLGTAGSVTRVAQIPDASVNDNNWHHLAFSITSSGTYVLYFDGSSYSGTVSGEGRSFNSGSYFAITTYDAGDSYNSICQIDQVRLFNRVITAEEVSDLYSAS